MSRSVENTMLESGRKIWKDFTFDALAKKELARFIITIDGTMYEKKFKIDEFLAEAFHVYYKEGAFNPRAVGENHDEPRAYQGSERLCRRMLEIVDCDNEKCQKWLDGQHERSEMFSRKQIHDWIVEAKNYNVSLFEVADLKNSSRLTEFGVDLAARPALRRVSDAIRKAFVNGKHYTYYSKLTYLDLATLQWIVQGYPELKIFDQLAIMDVYQSLVAEGRDTSHYDDWLSYRTWESDSNMNEYIDAVENRIVRRIGVFYSRNFDRPLNLFRYHLPTQLIDMFVPIEGRRGRDTDVLGVDAYDVFEISASPPAPTPIGRDLHETNGIAKSSSTLTLLSNYLDRRKEESPPLQKIEYDQFGNPIKPWEKNK